MSINKYFFFILILISAMSHADTKFKLGPKNYVGVYYYNKIFGHVHNGASKYSQTLTTISCGHPIKIYTTNLYDFNLAQGDDWVLAKVASYKGFLKRRDLSSRKIKCFQDLYPYFFDAIKLEISDLYYWGRLEGLYLRGRSRVR